MNSSDVRPISNTMDWIDSRDVIARIEQLQAIRQAGPAPEGVLEPDDYETDQDELFRELAALEALAHEGAMYVPDWEYGALLIHEDHFVQYAEEMAEEIGAVRRDASWPNTYIDWERAAEALKMDYIEIEFDGATYWGRA